MAELPTRKLSVALAALENPVFGFPVTMPSFIIGAIPVSASGTQLNYLNAAAGTTGTTSKKIVFSESPTLEGDVKMPGGGIWNSSGYVGIGTLAPSVKLDVAGAVKIRTGNKLYVDSTDASLPIHYQIWANETGGELTIEPIFNATASNIRFKVGDNGDGTVKDVMFLSQKQYVGIGTLEPKKKLHVNGDIRISYDGTYYADFQVDEDGNLTPIPVGHIIKILNTDNLTSDDWVNKFTGWGIYKRSDGSSGGADFRYIYTDELHAKRFIADLEFALAGGQIISKSVAVLYEDVVIPDKGASVNIKVEDLPGSTANVFVNGDWVQLRLLERNETTGKFVIANAYGTVTFVSHTNPSGDEPGYQTWTFARDAVDTGSADGETALKGALVLDFGVSGDGYVETTTVDDTGSPYQQIVTWATKPWTQTIRTRLGNLDGITGVGAEWGLFAGSVTDKKYLLASDTHFELHGIDISLYDGATNTAKISSTVPSIAMGAALPTGYLVGDGIWMGKDGAAYKFRVGTVSGGVLTQGISFDGVSMTLKGTLSIMGGSGIANLTDAGGLATKDSVNLNSGEVTNKSLANLDSTAATKLGTIATGATLGATWGVNLYSIPARLGSPVGLPAQLYFTEDYMGYWDGSAFKSYLDKTGNFILGDPSTGTGLAWTQSTGALTIRGSLIVSNVDVNGWNIVIEGSGIRENSKAADGSAVFINEYGYGGSSTYYRNFIVGDGKGNQVLGVEGNNVGYSGARVGVTGALTVSGVTQLANGLKVGNLPTSNPHINGQLYRDGAGSTTLKVSAG